MTPLKFLQKKFPLWETQDRLEFNTVCIREENLIQAMSDYAKEINNELEEAIDRERLLKESYANKVDELKKENERLKGLIENNVKGNVSGSDYSKENIWQQFKADNNL